MKKQISPNTLKKIFGKNKSTSNKKVLNNSIRKIEDGKNVKYNKNIKTINRKNINIVNLKNSNEILKKLERSNSPPMKIKFISKKTE